MTNPAKKIAAWEDVVLRIIAIYKLVHAAFFTAVGFGLLHLRHHNVVEFLKTYVIFPYHLNPESRVIDTVLDAASNLTFHKLVFLGYTAFFYAALFATEGVGLYLRQRWAEYMVVIVTGSLLPLEFYELYLGLAWWKVGIVLGNLLIVLYLIHRLLLDSSRDKPEKKGRRKSPRQTVRDAP